MFEYVRKVLIATLVIATAAIIAGLFTKNVNNAYLVEGCGLIIVANRHLCCCRSCGSWRTYITDQWVPDHRSEYGTVYEYRHCAKCKFDVPLGEYRAAMWEHKSIIGGRR